MIPLHLTTALLIESYESKTMKLKLFLLAVSSLLFHHISAITADITVAKDGSGDYNSIQEAIDNSPRVSSTTYFVIYIKNGIYEEAINIPSTKRNFVLYGEDNMHTIITYKTEKTLDLATLTVNATGFIAYNLTIENTAGSTYGPAQALRQEVDKSIYINCRLLGNQDTFRNSRVRSYFRNCYIDGTTDFIFGDATIVFEDCELYSKGGSAITAASTKDYVQFGYVFRNCRITSKKGTTTDLGRPWGDNASAVAYINCEMPKEINAHGWNNWGEPAKESTSRFAEFWNYGPGADITNRVSWAKMLTYEEADAYNTLNVLKTTYSSSPREDNWNPYEIIKSVGIANLYMEGDGYGRNEGGNGGTVVTVTTATELKRYATSSSKYVIQVAGNIELTGRIDVGSNTTITGINEHSGISNGTLNITNERRNVIIKYLNITNPDGDGISIWNGHNVFVHHVTFYDCGDGCCDINRGSDSVTVAWCKFYYPTQTEHRFTMIADGAMTWGTGDSSSIVIAYGAKLNLTMHHNWWYTKSDQRMPSSTNTNAHLYNNYWNCTGNYYCSNARTLTEFNSENNYYDQVNRPIYTEVDGKIKTSGNIYNNCTGTISPGTDKVFTPMYPYLLTTTEFVPEVVMARAGNVWPEGTPTSSSNNLIFQNNAMYPNPTMDGNFRIQTGNELNNAIINIFDVHGALIFQQNITKTEGTMEIQPQLSAGMYIVSIQTNGMQQSQKLLVR